MRYYYYWVAVIVFVIDFVTKRLVETRMEIKDAISVIGDFFLITSHRNNGAAFGILEGQRTFFIVITLVVVAGIIWYMYKMHRQGSAWLLTGLGLVLGGALGNFLDRVRYGEVVDFLLFNFGSYSFPIFNVADAAICIGVGCIVIDTLKTVKDEKKSEQKPAAE